MNLDVTRHQQGCFNFGLWVVVSFKCGVGVSVLLCPSSTNGVGVDDMCYLVNGVY